MNGSLRSPQRRHLSGFMPLPGSAGKPRLGRSLALPPFDALSLAQGSPCDALCLGAIDSKIDGP
jgi:hypothetical protein